MYRHNRLKLDEVPLLAKPNLFDNYFEYYDKIKNKFDKHIKKITAIGMLALFVGGAITCEFIQKYNEEETINNDIQNTKTLSEDSKTTSQRAEEASLKDLLEKSNIPSDYPIVRP